MSNLLKESHLKAVTRKAQEINDRVSKQFYDQFATDVTGVWLGYNRPGQGDIRLGRVMYEGEIYQVHVLSPIGLPKGSKCNLRRTKQRNFADW